MSQWVHSICEPCWDEREPDRVPHRVIGPLLTQEHCCFCSTHHESGIYVRGKPVATPCRGKHSEPPPLVPLMVK